MHFSLLRLLLGFLTWVRGMVSSSVSVSFLSELSDVSAYLFLDSFIEVLWMYGGKTWFTDRGSPPACPFLPQLWGYHPLHQMRLKSFLLLLLKGDLLSDTRALFSLLSFCKW